VKDRKNKEDRTFNTKMNEAVRVYNEKHATAESNRVANVMAVRNNTVDEMMSGSHTKLDHMTSAGQLIYNRTSRMQSANGRNLEHIVEGEDIQHKLEDIYKRIAGAENKKQMKIH